MCFCMCVCSIYSIIWVQFESLSCCKLLYMYFIPCRDALMVVTDIKQCLNDLEVENEDMAGVLVELVDPSMAAIYAKSKRGKVI